MKERASKAPRIQVFLADPYPELLEVISDLLRDDFDVVGTAKSGTLLLEKARELNPEIVVLDLAFADMTGFDAIRLLKEQGSAAKVIVLSTHESPEFVQAALKAGASGYVFKFVAATDLPEAIFAVSRGGTYFPCANRGIVY